jgi:hypothetical protein
LEFFASAGAVATAMMARVARVVIRIGRACVFLFVSIENLLELNIVQIQNYQYARHMPESFTEKPGIISQLAGQSKVGHVRGRENGKKRRRPVQICP